MTIRVVALVPLAAFLPQSAHSQAVMLTGGPAWTRMQPPDPEERSHVEFPSRSAPVLGLRGELPSRPGVFAVADLRYSPRGGYASFRQSYGYLADYLELSTRVAWRSSGRLAVVLSAGPTAALRVRHRNAWSLASEAGPAIPTFGAMSKAEIGVMGTVGLSWRSTGRLVVLAEGQYLIGLSNIHEPGSTETAHDPHVFDFRAKSRTLIVAAGIGIDLSR